VDLVKKSKLISLLNKVLKQDGKQTSDFEITFVCPFHAAVNNVLRKKFGINLDSGEYNCFACGESGKSFKTLFKKLKVSPALYKELYGIIGEHFKPNYGKPKKEQDLLKLPEEFLSIAVPSNSICYRHAVKYLKNRNITRDDILRYNIGYCEEGKYRNRIIIPSYNKDGELNFFAARDFLNCSYLKYLLPEWSKDIIGFELFINWNETITLVEGPLDAITVRRNAIPLFGKTMPPSLKESIFEYDVTKINVCLDDDAIKNALEMTNYLSKQGIDVNLIKLNGHDPSSLGFEKTMSEIKSSKTVEFSDIISMKMNT
jgi:DNA primase